MKYNIVAILCSVIAVAIISPLAFAQTIGGDSQSGPTVSGTPLQGPTIGGTPQGDSKLTNPLKYGNLVAFLKAVVDLVVTIAFPFLILFLMYAGFLFVSARGNQETLDKAKRVFLWTVIGSLLILGAWTLVNAIQGTVQQLRGDNHTHETPLV